jgi:hypothetical protein
MPTPVKHASLSKYVKKGWYIKSYSKSQKTRKCTGSYISRCKTGFQGGRTEAHHVLPKESFDDSLGQVPKADLVYVRWVMHVADWDLNMNGNLIGLPTVHSYELFFQDKITLDIKGLPKLQQLNTWFNKFKKGARQKYLDAVRAQSPETFAVHNPRSWGHPLYSQKIQDWMLPIWQGFVKSQDKHKDDESKALADANTLPGKLTAKARTLKSGLTGRAGANRNNWKKRHDKTDKTWYKPFTMAPVTKNPLTGK